MTEWLQYMILEKGSSMIRFWSFPCTSVFALAFVIPRHPTRRVLTKRAWAMLDGLHSEKEACLPHMKKLLNGLK